MLVAGLAELQCKKSMAVTIVNSHNAIRTKKLAKRV